MLRNQASILRDMLLSSTNDGGVAKTTAATPSQRKRTAPYEAENVDHQSERPLFLNDGRLFRTEPEL